MVPHEYHLYAQGFALREQITQLPFRRLYQLLYNVNSKSPIRGSAIFAHWPLPDIDKQISGMNDIDARKQEWEAAQEANRQRKQRQLELKQRQEDANRGA